MRTVLILSLVACGAGSTPPTEGAEATAAQGSEETEVTPEERYIAATTRIYEACYDDLDHLDEAHRARRELRIRRLREEEVDERLPAGLVVERAGAGGGQADTLDEEPTGVEYSAHEQQLIALEGELDAFRAERPDPETWSLEEWERFDDLADRLVAHCTAQRR